jgi:hypothetical protein
MTLLVWLSLVLLGLGVIFLFYSLVLKLMVSSSSPRMSEAWAVLGGVKDAARQMYRSSWLGAMAVVVGAYLFVTNYFPTLHDNLWIRIPSGVACFLLAYWMFGRFHHFRPDPLPIGDWMGHEKDRIKHGKS